MVLIVTLKIPDDGPVSKRRLPYLLDRVCVFEREGMCVGVGV